MDIKKKSNKLKRTSNKENATYSDSEKKSAKTVNSGKFNNHTHIDQYQS